MELKNLTNVEFKYESVITPRNHQIRVEDARNLRLIDLFTEEVNIGVIVTGYIILENFRKEFLFLVAISMLQLLFI